MMDHLIEQAVRARENAYAPYSHFRVGAALMTARGNIYTGCNVENQSYGLTNCAERTAIFKALSEGETEITVMAIAADTDTPVMPCGACRQVLAEFNPNMTLVLATLKGQIIETCLSELFPNPFHMEK